LQFELGESVAKLGVDAVGGVGQYNPAGHLRRYCYANLIQGDLRFGLKLNLFGHFCFFSSRGIRGPVLGQIETIGNRQTRTPRRHRQAHGDAAILLFAHLSAILTRDSD
jgi:hypothetical protein